MLGLAALLAVPTVSRAQAPQPVAAPVAHAGDVAAVEPAPAPEPAVARDASPPPREVQLRGYLLSRSQLFPTNTHAVLYPMLEVEKYQGFFEANLDATVKGARYAVRVDTSALYRVSPAGCRADSDAPACLVINELYATYDVVPDRLVIVAGRHRTSWGSALAAHPVEPMNPAPDPTDPTFQRLGAWGALAELSGSDYVATAGWFPEVEHAAIGTPRAIHAGLAGGRAAWRPQGFELGGVGFVDLATGDPQLGATGSLVVGDSPLELHGEALVHKRRALKTGTLEQGSCPIHSLGIPHRARWDATAVVGARWDRGDGAMINLEYLHSADGMEGDDFRAVLATADLLSEMCPNGRLEVADSAENGRPQQLSSTFLRRHYAALSAVKPTLGDDGVLANLGATASVFTGLDDLSGVASARLIYTLRDTTLIRLGGLVRFGRERTQYGILPFYGMTLLDVQTMF